MSRKEEGFKEALQGRSIPILTLDSKWHRIFAMADKKDAVSDYEAEVNRLLRLQGKLNNKYKDIKKLKKTLVEELSMCVHNNEGEGTKKVNEVKRLIDDCNSQMEDIENELLEVPRELHDANDILMIKTMEICYDTLKDNDEYIEEVSAWIKKFRVELKKKIIRKQERELLSKEIYSYMHDLFGVSVMDIFDIEYEPRIHETSTKESDSSDVKVKTNTKEDVYRYKSDS